jgi:Ca2+/Na+ antiporter
VVIVSSFYLTLLCYAMIHCCNLIGSALHAPPALMGFTLAAVGLSLPNLRSSLMAARAGYGNIAVCNAFGGNMFGVNVCLGVPWLLYTLLRPYHIR